MSMLTLNIMAIQDAADAAWNEMHEPRSGEEDRESYPCKLCGATMYALMDYTHESTCPVVIIEAAIDAYGAALTDPGRGAADNGLDLKEAVYLIVGHLMAPGSSSKARFSDDEIHDAHMQIIEGMQTLWPKVTNAALDLACECPEKAKERH